VLQFVTTPYPVPGENGDEEQKSFIRLVGRSQVHDRVCCVTWLRPASSTTTPVPGSRAVSDGK
jgi:hypothetical protein